MSQILKPTKYKIEIFLSTLKNNNIKSFFNNMDLINNTDLTIRDRKTGVKPNQDLINYFDNKVFENTFRYLGKTDNLTEKIFYFR